MTTRVTDGMMHDKSQTAINRSRRTMVENQEKAVSGKRVVRPSDDPMATVRSLELKQDTDRVETVLKNMTIAKSMVDLTDSVLGELSDVIVRSKELAIQGASYTNQSPEALSAISKEVEQLYLRAVQIGNSRLGDRYIFGGYQTDRAPFDAQGNYYGDEGVMELEMDKGQRMPINVPGSRVFLGIENLSPEAKDLRQDPAQDPQPTPTDWPRSLAMDEKSEPAPVSPRESSPRVNVFTVLKSFDEGLKSGTSSQIQEAVAGLDDAFKQILEYRATLGARQNVAEMGVGGLEATSARNQGLISTLEDADAFETFSNLARNESSLEAALKSSEKIVSRSLLDFLK
ncbi:MAG TPA: flagellar hook-associated protein FlgL [Bdellovibrionota bacterium]|nr:flagellar hook-associated protein FlgL [Bdellovibrionota bacterium]